MIIILLFNKNTNNIRKILCLKAFLFVSKNYPDNLSRLYIIDDVLFIILIFKNSYLYCKIC